jgi:hypothetical protein
MARQQVAAGVAAVASVAVGVVTNLLTALVPLDWVRDWRWPLAAGLAVAVFVPVFLVGRRHAAPDAGGSQARTVAVASATVGTLAAAVVTSRGRVLLANYREPGTWANWTDMGLSVRAVDVALVSPASHLLVCFVVDRDGDLWTARRDHDSWSAWQPLPVRVQHGKVIRITAASLTAGHQEVWCVTNTGQLLHSWRWHGHAWSDWVDGELSRCVDTAVCSPKDGVLEWFAVDRNGDVWHRWFLADTERWSAWRNRGRPGSPAGAVSTYRTSDEHREVFVVGAMGDVGHRWSIGAHKWSRWTAMDAPAQLVDVAAGATGPGHLHCLTVDADGGLWHCSYDPTGSRWRSWHVLPITAATEPAEKLRTTG